MNTLYVPPVGAEATRKRVISFKKPFSEDQTSKSKNSKGMNEMDEYLLDSDDEMDQESIEVRVL